MRYKGLDVNLLQALVVLIDLRNVSHAARQLNLSQPALSAALARLRTYFKDPLLQSDGKRLIPTPFLQQIEPSMRLVLAEVDSIINNSAQFDPAVSARHFRIVISDFLASVTLPSLMRFLSNKAPNITLELVPPSDMAATMLNEGSVDITIVPAAHVSRDHPSINLDDEDHVVAGWSGNPMFAARITAEIFAAAEHVSVKLGNLKRESFAESELRKLGIERKVTLTVSSFLVVPEFLVGTDRLAVMHRRLAVRMQEKWPIAFQPLPFSFPPLVEVLQYHRARVNDAALQWLIAQVVAQEGAKAEH
jgi:LysR family transcriptional regulator, nod-box dependent transcriptional activator